MQITKFCMMTNCFNTEEIPITSKEYEKYLDGGELIQNMFPQLNADQREFLISGIPIGAWDRLVGNGDES